MTQKLDKSILFYFPLKSNNFVRKKEMELEDLADYDEGDSIKIPLTFLIN